MTAFEKYLQSLSGVYLTPLTEEDKVEHWRLLVEIGADNMLGIFLFENAFGD